MLVATSCKFKYAPPVGGALVVLHVWQHNHAVLQQVLNSWWLLALLVLAWLVLPRLQRRSTDCLGMILVLCEAVRGTLVEHGQFVNRGRLSLCVVLLMSLWCGFTFSKKNTKGWGTTAFMWIVYASAFGVLLLLTPHDSKSPHFISIQGPSVSAWLQLLCAIDFFVCGSRCHLMWHALGIILIVYLLSPSATTTMDAWLFCVGVVPCLCMWNRQAFQRQLMPSFLHKKSPKKNDAKPPPLLSADKLAAALSLPVQDPGRNTTTTNKVINNNNNTITTTTTGQLQLFYVLGCIAALALCCSVHEPFFQAMLGAHGVLRLLYIGVLLYNHHASMNDTKNERNHGETTIFLKPKLSFFV